MKIVFAWELGAGFGHLAGLIPIAEQLRTAGADVHFVLRDLAAAEALMSRPRFPCWQAPQRSRSPGEFAAAGSYADILRNASYLQPDDLLGRLRAWQLLLAQLQPDAVLSEFAPTALLAARILGLRRIAFGSGFTIPPPGDPMPALLSHKTSNARLRQAEAPLLNACNRALQALGGQPLQRLSDIFADCERFISTWPELDHYSGRADSDFIGPRWAKPALAASWPAGTDPGVLLYLNAGHPQLRGVLQAIASSGRRCVAVVPNAPAQLLRDCGNAAIELHSQAVDLSAAATEAGLFVSAGGQSAVAQTLAAGLPQLLLPMHNEQRITTSNLSQRGLGRSGEGLSRSALSKLVLRMLGDVSLRQSAQAFASSKQDFDLQGQRDNLPAKLLGQPTLL